MDDRGSGAPFTPCRHSLDVGEAGSNDDELEKENIILM